MRSVLQEAHLYKSEIRELSKQHDLPVWNKPALCSLASRIPYGETLSFAKVNKVNEAEKYILQLESIMSVYAITIISLVSKWLKMI